MSSVSNMQLDKTAKIEYKFSILIQFSIVIYIIFMNTMEIGKKINKKDPQQYLQVYTFTQTYQQPQNSSLNPNSHMDLNLQTTQSKEDQLPDNTQTLQSIRNVMKSSLITGRRLRKKKTSNQSTSKQSLAYSTSNSGTDLANVKKIIKVTDLIKLFFQKIRQNSVFRKPVQYDPYQNQFNFAPNQFILQIQKIHIPKIAQHTFLACKIIFIIAYIFVFPLTLIFQQVNKCEISIVLKVLALIFSLLDILQLCQQTTSHDNHNISLEQFKKQIAARKHGILMQMVIIGMTIISIVLAHFNYYSVGQLFFIGVVLNIKAYLNQIVKLQNHLFTATHHEKYWNLFKVVSLNLTVCHLLACILIAVASIHPEDSWMVTNSINRAGWLQQYVWSYYFGTTIILTIGFGDLHPGNCFQAFFIIIISFCACVFFGYNINYIGNLINLIKQDQVEKDSKLKVINSLAKKTSVSSATLAEITNYIVQSSKIKKQSNYTQEKQLIQELPEGLRSSFLAEANQKLFNHLNKIVRFTNKTIQKLSLCIQAKICHPDQMLKRKNDGFSLMILQSGEIGYVAHLKESRLHSLVIERISNTIDQQSKLICVDILKNEHINYDIKSLAYSIVYQMKKDVFEDCIKHSKEDYQIYRYILDKCRYRPNQCGITQCRFCQNKYHTLFQCPKIHFKPFQKFIPLKYKYIKTFQKQSRVKYIRHKQLVNFYDLGQSAYFNKRVNTSESIGSLKEDKKVVIPRLAQQHSKRLSNMNNRWSYNHTKTRESYLITLEMVSQIREDIQSLKPKEEDSQFRFTFWDCIGCDQIFNFKYYFPKFNSSEYHQKQIKPIPASSSSSKIPKKKQHKKTI